MVNHEVFYYLSNECVHIDPEQISIKTARELLVRHPYLQHLRMKEFELSVLKSLWLWEDCPILSLQLDKCSHVHMHLSPSHQLQSRRRTCRTLILFTAFSSVYSYRTKWLTVSLLSCPQRHMDILHNYHSQSWGSQATLWLVQNRDLLWYSSQSEKLSPSIHKTQHHKVSWMITVYPGGIKGLQTGSEW